MAFPFRQFVLMIFAAGCVSLTSCSSSRYEPIPETGATLDGTVTYGGEKLSAALIIVAGADRGAQGMIGEDGRYKIENAPLGEVTIGVNTGAARGMMMAGGKSKNIKITDVPGKYADPMKSGIKTTIQKGQNTFDIKIPK